MEALSETDLDKKTIAKLFGMSVDLVYIYFRMPGSPAFKVGTGVTSPWRCNPNEFATWVKKQAEKYKG